MINLDGFSETKRNEYDSLSDSAKTLFQSLNLERISYHKAREQSNLQPNDFRSAKDELVTNDFIQVHPGRGGLVNRNPTLLEEIIELLAEHEHHLSKGGSKGISKTRICDELDMTELDWNCVVESAITRVELVRQQGRHTSIRLPVPSTLRQGVSREKELYRPVQDYFQTEIGNDVSDPNLYYGEDTSASRKGKLGKWSAPDFSYILITRYEFLPDITVEITTAEVKRYKDFDIPAVLEAAAHLRWGNRGYLIVEWLEQDSYPGQSSGKIERVEEYLEELGVGLIIMQKNNGDWEFKEILEPEWNEPLLENMDAFIKHRFPSCHRDIHRAIAGRWG